MQLLRRGRLTHVLSILGLCFAAKLHATIYYVSSSGSDSSSGTSLAAPWKTITKVNSKSFSAGDQIFFEGGKTFTGQISLDANDAGTTANPILISSYGVGRATINGGNGSGLYA